MAAPAVAGITALVLAEANRRGFDLTSQQIRRIITTAARRNPPAGLPWHDRYGHGRLSASAAVQGVIDLANGVGLGADVGPAGDAQDTAGELQS